MCVCLFVWTGGDTSSFLLMILSIFSCPLGLRDFMRINGLPTVWSILGSTDGVRLQPGNFCYAAGEGAFLWIDFDR